ncbi:MAG TPA: glutathione S-transferase [Methylophilaceae bacterium]|nr:glutathione S-transferase [Methylophilaceae bacterium]
MAAGALPVLFSFRRCPYAMRARMALRYSGLPFEIHEVSLKAKPAEMLKASPKGTVPVLVLPDGTVIDESLDIMCWALSQNDPENWLMQGSEEQRALAETLIAENDGSFKQALDRYKYFTRYTEQPREAYRAQGEVFLDRLETLLGQHSHLCRNDLSYADIAIFPFIRQFASADETWFEQAPYPHLRHWLKQLTDSSLFAQIMEKTKPKRPEGRFGLVE